MDHFTHIHNQGSASISATHSLKKSTQHQTTMAMKNLPEHIIIEILLRLPVKSLLRFRSVSKLWNSLISDPQFAKSHFDLAAAQTDRIMYIVNSEVRCIDFEASFHDDSSSVKLNFPLILPNFHPWIRGSCRGFLLLEGYGDFFIYNPSTNVCKRISYSPISMNIQFATVLHGFGYDASKDDYLIVLGSYEFNAEILVTHFEIFSFRTNSWKEIEGTHLPYMNAVDDPRAGILLNGAIHWFAYNYDRLFEVILAFDLIEKSSRELPMPNDFNQSLEFCGLEVLGGCLGLYILGDDDAEIWIMKEYGVKSSWTKSIVVSLKGNHSCYFSPICFTKGGDIVGEDGSTGLVKYNHNGELLEHHDYCHDKHGRQVAMYTESLLSLPSDSGGGGHWKQN